MFDTGGAKLKMYKLSKINALNYSSYTFLQMFRSIAKI